MNDKELYKKFMKILPEMTVFDLVRNIHNGYMNKTQQEIFGRYAEYATSAIKPKNGVLNKNLGGFNQLFRKFYSYVKDNFFIKNGRYELYPDHWHSKDEADRKFWEIRLAKAEKLATAFKNKHKKMVQVFQQFATSDSSESDVKHDETSGEISRMVNGKLVRNNLGAETMQNKLFELLRSQVGHYFTYIQIYDFLKIKYRKSKVEKRDTLTQLVRSLNREIKKLGFNDNRIVSNGRGYAFLP